MKNEPVIKWVSITTAIAAALVVAQNFGLRLTDAQSGSILAFLETLAPFATLVLGAARARSLVTPVAKLGGAK